MFVQKVSIVFLILSSLCYGNGFSQKRQTSYDSSVFDEKINLSTAVLIVPTGISGPEIKASQMLREEVEKRSRVQWPLSNKLQSTEGLAIILGQRSELIRQYPSLGEYLEKNSNNNPEGYRIVTTEEGSVIVAGNDERGVLFGAGKLLRIMYYSRDKVSISRKIDISSSPVYALRGHQLGYRPKTNAYDGWSVPMWEQYIRDLVVFGTNAIELIPPISDDDSDSPHFPLDQMKMMIEMSRLAKEYGIECWVWYPAMEKDYGNKNTVDKALIEWGNVLRKLPKVDAVFVPGGDPGHTAPGNLFALLEKQSKQLKQLHPRAKMWMSPQGFNSDWMNEFYEIMKTEPNWLEGIVFGPQQRESIEQLRSKVPNRYKMRFYPDITHSMWSQYPVPNWDFAYLATENREVINPRPQDEQIIFKRIQPIAEYGFLTYSEGCNDDVNKFIWSGLGWDPNESTIGILRDYSKYFIGDEMAEGFAQGLLSLEQNWRGSLLDNPGVETTLLQFQEMEHRASPFTLQNWRFQEALYRAYYDATDRTRLFQETAEEQIALQFLKRAPIIGSIAAIEKANASLTKPDMLPAAETRARVFELAEALFQSIHMQLSVPRYQAIGVRRGANLDLIDFPLNNAPWLHERFSEILKLQDEKERLNQIESIVNWSNPGAGGFYDDLGNAGSQPHLVFGSDYTEDPAFLKAPIMGMVTRKDYKVPISSMTYAGTLNDNPLEIYYPFLNKSAHYRVKIVYGPESKSNIKLVANDTFEIHDMILKNMDYQPLVFDIPIEATKTGELTLKWKRPSGLGGSGRGVQVAEVWLMLMPEKASNDHLILYNH